MKKKQNFLPPCGKIYIIRNDINDKVYIGVTTQSLKKRFSEHCSFAKTKHRSHAIHSAIREIGRSHFWIELLEENVPKEKMFEREIFYISKFNSFYKGYNQTKGGSGSLFNDSLFSELILREFKKGTKVSNMATFFEIDEERIRRFLREKKLYSEIKIKSHNEEKDILLRKLWNEQKKPLKEIALFFNVDTSTIKRWKRRLKLEKRTSQTAKRYNI